MNGRAWTADELDFLGRYYKRIPAAEIAYELRRTARQVWAAAKQYGFADRRSAPEERASQCRRIRELHAQGKLDTDIGAELGCSRGWVSELRRRLGLPVHYREMYRRALRAQLQSMGLSSPGEMRRDAYRRFVEESGWPPELLAREAQILNLLARNGPMTALQIAQALGMRTDRKNAVHGGAVLLAGCNNGLGGTYTASLLRRGLIVYMHCSRPSGKQGIGRVPGLYLLSARALALWEERNGTRA